MNQVKQYLSYAFGAFGHDAFYATLSTYFTFFVTSQLFGSGNHANDAKMISAVTLIMVIIRIVEIAFDPIIGGAVDNTHSRWGKFKPWLMIGATISSLMLILIFTDFGGLTVNKPTLYLILFGIVFVILDVFYSFKDISFWSMLPALTVDSNKRARFGTIARFGSTLGAQGVALIIMPTVTLVSGWFGGAKGQQNQIGWLGFAILIGVISFLGALATATGTKEEDNIIRENTEKVGILGIFKVLFKNDQLMWLALSYFLLAFGYVITTSLFLYYFRYVLGQPNAFWMEGAITAVLGIVSVILFPFLEALIKRKAIYVGGICLMLVGYVVFNFAGTSLAMTLVAISLIFFPYPMIFLAALMTITDSVEYGQLRLGTRNESVTLAVRPLLDKLAGAFANGIVVIAAIHTGMSGNAKPSDISSAQLLNFHMYIFYAPMVMLVIAAVVYLTKVTLTEAKHAEVVKELEKKLGADSEDIAKIK
ncbi:glycoside-pentoside-hexuronide (GPH):cation symporter [Furfurilactobacillus rossiae]|uniref:Na+ xyloside symporter or related transporter n=1 Tax=Furfurilactobacillus rossiae DSM 15814 TaxID=1114972 RepID=A0A0R1RR76_9LACO|nr:glycoside-pentoside-hexuronide (GPH):cation symporter [Furfurilactobacillus rossiae]KRL56578.1 Na+ xyloside symporter or related transporter [Furfurilactobacillus rossiae DSM 15814]QFR66517.1 MFS transporter [Furfurilactobacillus rossiae]QLE61983.1 Lactose and galactose permease GPH [Furfurilactobacillus rossiae]